jgi:hypothetical protein
LIASEKTAIQKNSTLREEITLEARDFSKTAPSAIFEDHVSLRSLRPQATDLFMNHAAWVCAFLLTGDPV